MSELKWVVVTGASRGIGFGITRRLLRSGYGVIGIARNVSRLEQAATKFQKDGHFEPVVCDLADEGSVDDFWVDLADRAIVLDGLVNNAGIAPHGPAIDLSMEEVRRVLDINVRSVFQCCVGAFKLMHGRGGAIVNITSIEAKVGIPQMAAYCASKFGVQGLTQCLAVEWARYGIRVNSVAPGTVATEMTAHMTPDSPAGQYLLRRTPMRRFAEPEEISGAVAFLLSGEASYITGTEILVDGGFSA